MAKEDQPVVETEGGGGNKKMIIIIGAAVAVALILGVVAFMMMGKGDKKDDKKEGAATEAKADAHGGGHGGAAPGAPAVSSVFALDPFIVNIYDGQELRYLKVKVEIEMVSAAIKPEVEGRLAAIRDSIVVLLSAKTLRDIQDAQGKNQLKEEILSAINKIIPPGKVAKVYFTDFVVQ